MEISNIKTDFIRHDLERILEINTLRNEISNDYKGEVEYFQWEKYKEKTESFYKERLNRLNPQIELMPFRIEEIKKTYETLIDKIKENNLAFIDPQSNQWIVNNSKTYEEFEPTYKILEEFSSKIQNIPKSFFNLAIQKKEILKLVSESKQIFKGIYWINKKIENYENIMELNEFFTNSNSQENLKIKFEQLKKVDDERKKKEEEEELVFETKKSRRINEFEITLAKRKNIISFKKNYYNINKNYLYIKDL